MKLTDHDFDLIQRYLADEATDQDNMQIQERLTNQTFKDELLFQAQMVDALGDVDYLQVREELVSSTATDQPTSSLSLIHI